MDELSPAAKSLLRSAQSSFDPSDEQLTRLEHRLQATWAEPPPEKSEAPWTPTPSKAANWPIWLVVSGFVLGIAGWGVTRLQAYDERPPAVVVSNYSPVLPPRPSTRLSFGRGFEMEPALAPTRRATQTSVPVDHLAIELNLISRSRRALANEQYGNAQQIAEHYLRRFPAGAFVEEARALVGIADCWQREPSAARSVAQKYLHEIDPLFSERVRRACLR